MMSMTILSCFSDSNDSNYAIPIQVLFESSVDKWLALQNASMRQWAKLSDFHLKKILMMPSNDGALTTVVVVIKDKLDWLQIGALPLQLPKEKYYFSKIDPSILTHAYLAWGLGAYQYTRYKNAKREPAQLTWCDQVDQTEVTHLLGTIYLVRDLINTPFEDMTPEILSNQTEALAKKFQATFTEVVGKDLLKKNFPCIYHVGRGSAHKPRLLELRWGNAKHPKITLVGKGVCFDTGGLNLKNEKGILMMKKDMGGAAHVLGLAQLIMAQKLPIRLRVLIPAVENAISGSAYHPGDVLTSRIGKTIEITNTDAEGRLVLCDALAAAAEEKPELIIDFATLTGAAKIAVGTEIAAFFTNDEKLAQKINQIGKNLNDPTWRLPLFTPYLKLLDSTIADITNCGTSAYAGAIVAALFLQTFIPDQQKWCHFDIMAWNLHGMPSKPKGGEAMALRVMYEILKSWSKE